MKREYRFYVYIMASKSGTLYVGFTNGLEHRVHQHKTGFYDGFTKWYQCHKLVYFEEHEYVLNAIGREKQIKRWRREKKECLIRTINPSWKDLSIGWYEGWDSNFFIPTEAGGQWSGPSGGIPIRSS